MEFKAYRRSDGAYLLVPDCLVASREAQARHGPLTLAARFDADLVSGDPLWQRVLEDIDRQSYAVIRRENGDALLRATVYRATA
ncbi:hypothetical protein [Lysobacter xanthus]